MITVRHAISGLTGPSIRFVPTLFIPALLLTAIVLSSGCTLQPDRVDGVVEGVQQDDVPHPPKFEVRHSWMYNHPETDTGFFRSCVTEFVGRGKLKALTSWYIDEMTELGWRRRDVDIGSTRVMTFSKRQEYAKVSILRDYNVKDRQFEIVVTVEIGPERTEDVPIYQVIPAPGSSRVPSQDFGDLKILPKNEIGKFEPVKPYETQISVLQDDATSGSHQTRRASLESFSPEVLPAASTSATHDGTPTRPSYDAGRDSRPEMAPTSSPSSTSGVAANAEVTTERGPSIDEAIHGPPLPDVLEDEVTEGNNSDG